MHEIYTGSGRAPSAQFGAAAESTRIGSMPRRARSDAMSISASSAPQAPRAIAATPVRATSTRPSGRIRAMKASTFSGAPVSSKTKLSSVVSTTLARKTSASAHRLDPLLAGAGDLDQRELALHRRALDGQVVHVVDRHEPAELGLDLLDHRRRAGGHDGDAARGAPRGRSRRRSGCRCCSRGPRTGR